MVDDSGKRLCVPAPGTAVIWAQVSGYRRPKFKDPVPYTLVGNI